MSVFLCNRTQRVVENCLSAERIVLSGVPQGSVLGPILFLLYVNDIETVCCGSTKFKLFADDLKLYSEIVVSSNSANNCVSVTDLQLSVNKLVVWAFDWQLSINFEKCSVLGLRGRASVSSQN